MSKYFWQWCVAVSHFGMLYIILDFLMDTIFFKLDASISRCKGRERSYTVGPVGVNKRDPFFQNVLF
jgi:hypothetical protein